MGRAIERDQRNLLWMRVTPSRGRKEIVKVETSIVAYDNIELLYYIT